MGAARGALPPAALVRLCAAAAPCITDAHDRERRKALLGQLPPSVGVRRPVNALLRTAARRRRAARRQRHRAERERRRRERRERGPMLRCPLCGFRFRPQLHYQAVHLVADVSEVPLELADAGAAVAAATAVPAAMQR